MKCCCYETHVLNVAITLPHSYRYNFIFSESDYSFFVVPQNLAVDQDCHHGPHQNSAGEDRGHRGLSACEVSVIA